MAQKTKILVNEEVNIIEKPVKKAGKVSTIVSIVLTSLATIAFIFCLYFFIEFVRLANLELPDDPNVSEGLSKGLGQVVCLLMCIIIGAAIIIVSIIGFIFSILGKKWNKPVGVVLFIINLVYMISPIIMLLIMIITGNQAN